jgi:hypothetical protein
MFKLVFGILNLGTLLDTNFGLGLSGAGGANLLLGAVGFGAGFALCALGELSAGCSAALGVSVVLLDTWFIIFSRALALK